MRRASARARVTGPALRSVGLCVAVLLLLGFLWGGPFGGEAQAAVAYNDQEIAFLDLLNEYRAANGVAPLLVSDLITEACERHSSDMAKYRFFSHYSLQSDWFPTNASPWDRMAASGYGYSTSKAENLAAGQGTAQLVFSAWKGSAGHNANMLNSAYKVIGVSFHQLAGSPYTYYWTTDFGGYVDATAHAVGAPVATRFQQTDSRIKYAGTWGSFSTSKASGGSYRRGNVSSCCVTITFNGTYLAWIATKGTTLGKAFVSLDEGPAQSVNLAASTAAYQQKVWNTGTLVSGQHTVRIWWDPSNIAGKYISLDAVDVIGYLVQVTTELSPTVLRYEQTDNRIDYEGTWGTFSTSGASAGSYRRGNVSTSSATVTFSGTYLVWIATKGTTLGKAFVSLDGGPAQSVNLAASSVAYRQAVWNTGTLASGQHTVRIWWDPSNISGKYISLDAVDVIGTLN